MLHYIKQGNIPTIFLQIDYCKAFDSVNWDFIRGMFTALGFPPSFIRVLLTISIGASSKVIVNKCRGDSFLIPRSLRQGYPLSPLIFVFIAEALSHCVHSAVAFGHIKGVEVLGLQAQYINGGFADDTHFVLDSALVNLQNIKALLEDFGVASRLTIQWMKSEACWLSQYPRPATTDLLGWAWKERDHVSKFLGFPFSTSIVPEVIHNFLLEKIRSKLAVWSTFQLSPMERILVVNHLLASKLWYTLTLCTFSEKLLKQV